MLFMSLLSRELTTCLGKHDQHHVLLSPIYSPSVSERWETTYVRNETDSLSVKAVKASREPTLTNRGVGFHLSSRGHDD
jgi:hypothetical protein